MLLILGKNFLYISVPEKIEEKIRNSFIVLMDINRKWHNSNEQKSYQYYKHHHLYRIFKNIQFKSSHDSLSGIDPTDMTSTERSIMYKTIGGDSIIDVYIDGKCYQLARYKKNIEYYQRHTGKQIILGTYVGGHLTTSKNDLSNWIIDYKIEKRLKQLDNLVLEDSIDPVLLKYFNKKNNSKYDQFLSEAKKNLLNSSINEHFEIFKKSTGLEKPNYIKNLFGELIIIEHLLEKLTETDNPNKINIYLIHLLKFNAKIHINTFLKKLSDIDRKNLILNQIHLIEQKILNSKNNFSLCENKNRQGGARNGK